MTALAVIGAGQAACTLIAELLRGDFQGTIQVFNAEGIDPYQRPPLSKTSFGQTVSETAHPLLPPQYKADPRVTWVASEVTAIDPDQGRVTANGTDFFADHLVLATGTRATRPTIAGVPENALHTLRTHADRLQLEQALAHASTPVIIGAGFMAFELAAVIASDTRHVQILARGPRALPQVSAESAAYLVARSQAKLHTNCHAVRYDPHTQTLTTNQGELETDCLIATVGSRPNSELLEPFGLADADGVAVDAWMQTPHPRVSAIGEVCRHLHPSVGQSLRVESISEANDTATTLAKRLLGQPVPFQAVPWFWSDQGREKLQIAGLAARDDAALLNLDAPDRQVVIRHRAGQVTAVEAINTATEFMAARRLFEQGPIALNEVHAAGSMMALLQSSRSSRS